MKKYKVIILLACLFVYAGLYIATTPGLECDGDCESVNELRIKFREIKSYVIDVLRCTPSRNASDTLCLFVTDTVGVDWNHLADTTCIMAQEKGLMQQKILILKVNSIPYDTLARKICP